MTAMPTPTSVRDMDRLLNNMQTLLSVDEHVRDDNRHMTCLAHAVAACRALRAAGLNPVLQAGTMNWLAVAPEYDDGVSATHFSYEWQPFTTSMDHVTALHRVVHLRELPEIHVWVYLRDRHEMIDLTTRYHKQRAMELCPTMRWTAPEPPATLWIQLNEASRAKWGNVIAYTADPDAIWLAMWAVASQYGQRALTDCGLPPGVPLGLTPTSMMKPRK